MAEFENSSEELAALVVSVYVLGVSRHHRPVIPSTHS